MLEKKDRRCKIGRSDFIRAAIEFVSQHQPVSITELAMHLDVGWGTSRALLFRLMAEGQVSADRHNMFCLKELMARQGRSASFRRPDTGGK